MPRATVSPARQQRLTQQMVHAAARKVQGEAASRAALISVEVTQLQDTTAGLDVPALDATLADYDARLAALETP